MSDADTNIEGSDFRSLNDWFLSLPEGRQAVLREDKWMLAEAAWRAGKEAQRCATARAILRETGAEEFPARKRRPQSADLSTPRNFLD